MAESYISELGDSLSHGVANTNGDRVKIIAPKLYNDGNGNHPSIATALSEKVSKSGDTMTGGLEIQGVKSGTSYANSGGGYNANYNNIILRGDPTYGTSGILFTSSKGTTSVNQPTDRGFIQFHSMGVTPVAEGSTPTMSSSGEANSLVIGVGNDSDDEVWIQTPATSGIKHVVGPTKYTIYDAANLPAATSASAVATTSSAGSASTFSRGDHVHSISLATGDNDGQVKIAGSNVSVKGWGNDSDGNKINTTYLKLSGGTMTGKITAQAGQYTDDNVSCAINMNNSNIIGLNSIYTADASDSASEGIHFYRDATHVDTLWMAGGALYFVPNRALGTSTSAADSQKVARLPASIPDNQAVLTNGTDGALKTSTLDAACNLFINALTTGTSTPTDNDYYVSQYAGGGSTTTSYHRRPVSALWTYIKGKMTSVSGVNISGNAATATSATNSTNSAVAADTTHQLYLIGATGSSGQQALKTDTGIYATATAGQLHATTFDVNSKCTLQFNTTTNALDFVFT